MKKSLSREEARKKIDNFFRRNELLKSGEIKKIKRLAMKYKIKLGKLRARFCKKCYTDLRSAKIRITNDHKIATCEKCGFVNKIRIS